MTNTQKDIIRRAKSASDNLDRFLDALDECEKGFTETQRKFKEGEIDGYQMGEEIEINNRAISILTGRVSVWSTRLMAHLKQLEALNLFYEHCGQDNVDEPHEQAESTEENSMKNVDPVSYTHLTLPTKA